MINFNTVAELIELANKGNCRIHDIVLQREVELSRRSEESIREAVSYTHLTLPTKA